MPPSYAFGLTEARLPNHQSSFRDTDRPIEHEREYRQEHDSGDHGIHIEKPLGLVNEVADSLRGAEVFADDRADEGKSHRVMQTGEHPAHGARHVNVAKQLARTGSEH